LYVRWGTTPPGKGTKMTKWTEEQCIEVIRTATSLEGKLYGLNELRKVRGR